MDKTILMLFNDLDYYTANIPEYEKKRKKVARRHDVFWNRLKELDKSLLPEMEKILDEQMECDWLEVSEAFCNGFRLGARLMLDVMSEK